METALHLPFSGKGISDQGHGAGLQHRHGGQRGLQGPPGHHRNLCGRGADRGQHGLPEKGQAVDPLQNLVGTHADGQVQPEKRADRVPRCKVRQVRATTGLERRSH